MGYERGVPVDLTVVQIDGKPVELHTAQMFARMRAAAKAAGVILRVVSGFRTMAEQEVLYAAYLAGTGAQAARPGFSNHQSGRALDLNTRDPGVYAWLTAHAREFGFRRTVPSEIWHWERSA